MSLTATPVAAPLAEAPVQPAAPKGQTVYFPNLDGIRSIACLFVLSGHIFWETVQNAVQRHTSAEVFKLLEFFLGNGGMGVRIFFCLSGFLITYLILLEVKKTGHLNVKNFYIRRVLRIWPLYFVVVLFVFVGVVILKHFLHNTSPIYESRWMSSLFLNNFDNIRMKMAYPTTDVANPMLGVLWSVSIEEQFYAFWPLLFLIIPVKAYKYLLPLIIVGSVGFALVYTQYNWGTTVQDHTNANWATYFHTVSNMIFLSAGGTLAWGMLEKKAWLERTLQFPKAVWAIILLAGVAGMIYLKEPLVTNWYGFATYYLFCAIVVCLFIFNQIAAVKRPIELSKAPWLINMGKLTYGLYMYHRIVLYILGIVLLSMLHMHAESKVFYAVYIPLTFAGSYLLAWLSYNYFEKKFLKLKDKFSLFHKPAGTEAG